MKNKSSLIVSISNINDLNKITKQTKYINLDITNPNYDITNYFIKHGMSFMYSDIIDGVPGYNYVNYDDFVKAENIIDVIYANMPNNLNKLEVAKYLYISIVKYVSFDINIDQKKSELYNLSLISTVNNLWGSLAIGRVSDVSISKIYYYLCRRLDIDISLVVSDDNKLALTKLIINNQVLLTDLYEDLPFIKCNMKTRHFATYNDDIVLDKKIKYIKNKYNDYYIDKALKDVDYTKKECIYTILNKTEKIIDVDVIKPVELGIIYKYIFDKYCPNYNVKINNLFLNSSDKLHFIMISYNDNHYSYNYKKKNYVKISEEDILNSIFLGKIGIYHDENIPNIGNKMHLS